MQKFVQSRVDDDDRKLQRKTAELCDTSTQLKMKLIKRW